MNHILTAATPAVIPMLGSVAGPVASAGKKVVFLLGFNAPPPAANPKPVERKNWHDHRPPPRWGINE